MHSHVDVYNFSTDSWTESFEIPKDMANSHLGVATDGRYIYIVTGQYGPQCRGPTANTFVLDTETRKWESLPPLPAPRYVICVLTDYEQNTYFIDRDTLCIISLLPMCFFFFF